MGCQAAIAAQIVEQGADYVLALKSNQRAAHDRARRAFADVPIAAGTTLPLADTSMATPLRSPALESRPQRTVTPGTGPATWQHPRARVQSTTGSQRAVDSAHTRIAETLGTSCQDHSSTITPWQRIQVGPVAFDV